MSDFERLRETRDDPWLRDLLEHAADEAPSERVLRATLAAVAGAAATIAGTASASAQITAGASVAPAPAATGIAVSATASAAKASLLVIVVKSVAVGALVGLVTAGGTSYLTSRHATANRSPNVRVIGSSKQVRGVPRNTTSARSRAAAPSSPVASSVRELDRGTAKPERQLAPREIEETAPTRNNDVVREVAALDRVRAALAAGDASESARLSDDYEREFTRGELHFEGRYLRMQAELALGNVEAAARIASEIVKVAPRGPHAVRAVAVLKRARLMDGGN